VERAKSEGREWNMNGRRSGERKGIRQKKTRDGEIQREEGKQGEGGHGHTCS